MSYAAPSILPSGATFAQFQAGGASGQLERLIAAQPTSASPNAVPTAAATISLTGGGQSILNPTVAATASATGGGRTITNPTSAVTASATGGGSTGGSLPAAATGYFIAYTFVTAAGGETTVGTSVNSSVLPVTAGNIPTATLPALATGAVAMNVYVSAPNGTNTVLYLYAKGVTGVTFALGNATWNNGVTAANLATQGILAPTSNTCTGPSLPATLFFGYTWVHKYGETTLGASASTSTSVAAGNVPQVTVPSLATGALSWNLYAGGSATTMTLYSSGNTGTTANLLSANWQNGSLVQASAKSPPTVNSTVGTVPPGAYLLNFTETNGIGETTVSTESSSFTIASQTAPSTANTSAAASTGGALPAAAVGYLAAYSYVDSKGGETTVGTTETASATVLTAGQILTVTFGDTLPGWAVSRNLYLTGPNGATGTETLYATGITASTFACSSGLWLNGTIAQSAAAPVPAANSTSKDIPRVTFPALQTGNTARNVYLTAPGGATGTEVLYQTGVTGLTMDIVFFPPGAGFNGSFAVLPPTTNTTGLSGTKLSMLRSAKDGNLGNVYLALRSLLANFNSGEPIPANMVTVKLRDCHLVFAMLAQLCQEAGTLADANAGTLAPKVTGIGGSQLRRSWP